MTTKQTTVYIRRLYHTKKDADKAQMGNKIVLKIKRSKVLEVDKRSLVQIRRRLYELK
jgi:RecA/RadA recombinase